MTIATTSSAVGRTLLRHAPLLALVLAVIAAVMLVLGPMVGVSGGGISGSRF